MNGKNRLSDTDIAEIRAAVGKGQEHVNAEVLAELRVINYRQDEGDESLREHERRIARIDAKLGRVVMGLLCALTLFIGSCFGLRKSIEMLLSKVIP